MACLHSGHLLNLVKYCVSVRLLGRVCAECVGSVKHNWKCNAGAIIGLLLELNDMRKIAKNKHAAIPY